MLKVGTEPMERQGKTLSINFDWPGVSAKVVEQNVTSPIEGIVTSVKGIESVSSDSYFGRSEIRVQLKPESDVSSIRFEISSCSGRHTVVCHKVSVILHCREVR
nr:efflux RND transporter permease subunit [Phocaeicola paurosaccharolyticus]